MSHMKASVGRSLATALMLAAAPLLASCDDQSALTGAEYIERALEQRENANLRASLIELRNAVRLEPDNARARALLGQTYMDLGNPLTAEKELLRARELGGDPGEWMLPLARAWASQGEFDKILEGFQADAGMPPEVRSDALYARGTAFLGKNDPSSAEQAFEAAVSSDPANELALIGLGMVDAQQGDYASAEERLEQAAAIAPEGREVAAFRGRLLMTAQRYQEAEETFRALAERYPHQPLIRLSHAHALLALGRGEEAVPMLDAVLEALPNNIRAAFLRSLAAYQVQDFETAKTHSARVLGAVATHPQSLLIAGASDFALGNMEQATARLEAFLARVPGNIPARRMLGLAHMRLGDAQRAYEILQPIGDAETDNAQLQAMVGAAAVRSGDLESAARYLERASELEPDSANLRAQLGAVRVGMGDTQRGVADLESAVTTDPTLDRALLSLALTHMREQEYDKVIEVARRLTESAPDSTVGRTIEGIALAAKGETAAAKTIFESILEEQPTSTDALINLASLEMRAGNEEKALEILRDGVAAGVDEDRVVLRLAQIERRMGLLPEAEEHLRRVVERNPDQSTAKLLLAEVLARQTELQESLDLARQVAQAQPNNASAHEIIGRISLAQGNVDKAIAAFEDLAEVRPDAAEAHYLLAQAYRLDGERIDDYVDALERSVSVDETFVPGRIRLASALTQRGEVARAKELLASLEALAPDNPSVDQVRAGIALRESRLNDAVAAARPEGAIGRAAAVARVVAGGAFVARLVRRLHGVEQPGIVQRRGLGVCHVRIVFFSRLREVCPFLKLNQGYYSLYRCRYLMIHHRTGSAILQSCPIPNEAAAKGPRLTLESHPG